MIAMRLPFFARRPRHAVLDVVLEVGGDALQSADRDRSFLDPAAAARRLAWTIAGAPQNSGKHVRSPIDHVSVAVAALSDQADVFWNGRMRGTGPLAVDHFVKIVGCRDISRFHSYLVRAAQENPRGLTSVVNAHHGVLVVFLPWIMGLCLQIQESIQYDRRCTEKPFLRNRHSHWSGRPAVNAASLHAALQQCRSIPGVTP